MARARLTSDPVSAAVVAAEAEGWQDAIRVACRPLVAAGAVEPGYADACVAAVDNSGPYIVVTPGIALAHARPEDGALSLGLAVATLSTPIVFGHPTNDPVDLVFAFGSPDRCQHTGLLAALSRALVAGLADRLRRARTGPEARSILQEVIDDVDDR